MNNFSWLKFLANEVILKFIPAFLVFLKKSFPSYVIGTHHRFYIDWNHRPTEINDRSSYLCSIQFLIFLLITWILTYKFACQNVILIFLSELTGRNCEIQELMWPGENSIYRSVPTLHWKFETRYLGSGKRRTTTVRKESVTQRNDTGTHFSRTQTSCPFHNEKSY